MEREIVDSISPETVRRTLKKLRQTLAERMLVMDNLNTHHPSSLYEAFEPADVLRIPKRLEIHYTPKHGSRLNMAEIELGCWPGSAWTNGYLNGRS